MEPKTLSASAGLKFELCEANYKASYIDRTPDIDGTAGSLGSAVHGALQFWIESEQYKKDWPTFADRQKAMRVVWEMTYPDYFSDRTFYDIGWTMLDKWIYRTHFINGREVVETEVKKTFDLPTSRGVLPVTYIFDRLDIRPDGVFEVVDYKTVSQPIQPADMRVRIQPRLYALAVMIEYKVKECWVTYDLLRYESVSVFFTRDDCIETWNYLKNLAERVYASDGTRESLNPECRFCVRKLVCDTLLRHADGGGVLGIGSLNEATDRLAQLTYAKSGIDAAFTQLADHVLDMAKYEEVLEWETETTKAKVTASARREVDTADVARIIGAELVARYGKVGVGDLDDIIKTEPLTDSQKSQLKGLVKKKYGAPRVVVKPKSALDEE